MQLFGILSAYIVTVDETYYIYSMVKIELPNNDMYTCQAENYKHTQIFVRELIALGVMGCVCKTGWALCVGEAQPLAYKYVHLSS
jgi:hypothetical protein